MNIVIFSALVERKFEFQWPIGTQPDNWHNLGIIIERELGGNFNSFPDERLSKFTVTSAKNDNAIIDDIIQIINRYLPQDAPARIAFEGYVDEDTEWKR